ncbi:MAG: M50 family metallopeptidase [Candidatus Peribacteraceae bacterium]|nr:M50 family metallopeptidase [Candidatus Peribacteraceae bacterium]
MISALAFLLLLSVLVLIHECGHYFAAKEAGVTVEEFGFGLPPRAKTLFTYGGTRFSLNWIPFGGFVRLKGENLERESDRHKRGSFSAASIPARIVILSAGVAMNFLFALLLFTVGFSVGRWIPTYLTYEELQGAAERGEVHLVPGVLIDEVIAGGGAEQAGIPVPSILTAVSGTPVTSPDQVAPLQEGKRRVSYALLTGTGFTQEVTLTLPVRDGKTGVSLRASPRELSAPARSVGKAFLLSLREARVVTVQTVIGMEQLAVTLFSQGRIPEGVTGIVGIAELTHLSVQEGFTTYLRLVALLSLSLAVLNILPLPALDGGRLLFVLVELVRRKPANRQFEITTNLVGFLLLIGLILVITYNDIIRLF